MANDFTTDLPQAHKDIMSRKADELHSRRILAANDSQGGTLTTFGNANSETTNQQYDADAATVIEFMDTLPSGVVDRVVKHFTANSEK